MIAPNIALGLIVIVMVAAGLYLVLTQNVVHAALCLMIVLAGVAAIFLLLGAEFLGWTQVLVYIGAIVVLFMFGVMLTKAKLGDSEDLDHPKPTRLLAAGVAGLIFVLFALVFVQTYGAEAIRLKAKPRVIAGQNVTVDLGRTPGVLDRPTVASELGNELFANWVLPFEAVSVVLLAALIGAIVLARRDDPDHVVPRSEQDNLDGVLP